MMHMTFYWGIQATILFDFWKTQTFLDYSLSLLACLLFSSFYQYLENLRLRLALPPSSDPIRTPLLSGYASKISAPGGCALRAAGAGLFAVNSALGYMIMLAVMSFNAGVFIAVVVGLAIGYFFFRSDSPASVAADSSCACA